MKRIRRINPTVWTLAAVAFALVTVFGTAAPAYANPLLSGYGGPGQGSQVLLGSTLLNGPRSGGGQGGPRGGSAAAITTGSERTPTRTGSTGGGARGSAPPAPRARAVAGSSYPLREPLAASVSTDPLGLSGTDIAFIALALCVLVATAVLLGRLARTHRGGAGS